MVGLQIIPPCKITSSKTANISVLKTMLNRHAMVGEIFEGWRSNVDKGYDSNSNCRALFAVDMVSVRLPLAEGAAA